MTPATIRETMTADERRAYDQMFLETAAAQWHAEQEVMRRGLTPADTGYNHTHESWMLHIGDDQVLIDDELDGRRRSTRLSSPIMTPRPLI